MGAPTHSGAYLDAASGLPLHPLAREALLAAYDDGWADPGRLHQAGRRAAVLLDAAREAVAEVVGARPDEISFTPSGLSAMRVGLRGLLTGPRSARTLLYSAVEQSTVLHLAEAHAAARGAARAVQVDRVGRIDQQALADMLSDQSGPALAAIALQAANHEVGTRQPVTAVAELARAVPVFMDASATLGRDDLPAGWAVLSADARLWGGPALGVLGVRNDTRWQAPDPADGYEAGRVADVPNVPAAVAAAVALRAVEAERVTTAARQHSLIARIRSVVASSVPDVDVLGDDVDRLPHLVTFSFLYVDGEVLLDELGRLGIAVSSGSSCTAATLQPSHVLAAMGALTSGNLRVSLGPTTSDADVDRLLAVLPGIVADVRSRLGADQL